MQILSSKVCHILYNFHSHFIDMVILQEPIVTQVVPMDIVDPGTSFSFFFHFHNIHCFLNFKFNPHQYVCYCTPSFLESNSVHLCSSRLFLLSLNNRTIPQPLLLFLPNLLLPPLLKERRRITLVLFLFLIIFIVLSHFL